MQKLGNVTYLPLKGGVGVQVTGIDFNEDIDPDLKRDLYQLYLQEGIVLFKDVRTPEKHLELSRCFGELEIHPIEHFRLPECPELILLSNANGLTGPVYEYDGVPTYGRIPWHTDLSFATTPNAGSLLRMVQKTEHGGQTGWIDTQKAYDALPTSLKERINGLEARYELILDLNNLRFYHEKGVLLQDHDKTLPSFPPVAHPLVWTHPETQRKILNVSVLNIQSIIGMQEKDSDKLIQSLIDHVLRPEFQYVHEWTNNDVMLWDNRRTQHMAFGYPVNEIRIGHRTTLRGTVKMGRIIE